MSAGQTTPQDRYQVARGSRTFSVYDAQRVATNGFIVDYFRSEASAHYSARILNEGRASIDVHAPVGCKVVAS